MNFYKSYWYKYEKVTVFFFKYIHLLHSIFDIDYIVVHNICPIQTPFLSKTIHFKCAFICYRLKTTSSQLVKNQQIFTISSFFFNVMLCLHMLGNNRLLAGRSCIIGPLMFIGIDYYSDYRQTYTNIHLILYNGNGPLYITRDILAICKIVWAICQFVADCYIVIVPNKCVRNVYFYLII